MAQGGIKDILVPISRHGWPLIGIFAGVAVLLSWLWQPLGWVGAILTLWCIYFFRDPDRVTPTGEGLIVSPADGVVQMVTAAVPPTELGLGDEPLTRVAIFMNVFNVHVNRIPIDGTVEKIAYRPGLFLKASLDKASEDNERQSITVKTKSGAEIGFVQIAGLVARRIVTEISEGDVVRAGQRFGMIRFGSRVDVYLPKGVKPLVRVGQLSIAAETVIADLGGGRDARAGEVR